MSPLTLFPPSTRRGRRQRCAAPATDRDQRHDVYQRGPDRTAASSTSNDRFKGHLDDVLDQDAEYAASSWNGQKLPTPILACAGEQDVRAARQLLSKGAKHERGQHQTPGYPKGPVGSCPWHSFTDPPLTMVFSCFLLAIVFGTEKVWTRRRGRQLYKLVLDTIVRTTLNEQWWSRVDLGICPKEESKTSHQGHRGTGHAGRPTRQRPCPSQRKSLLGPEVSPRTIRG